MERTFSEKNKQNELNNKNKNNKNKNNNSAFNAESLNYLTSEQYSF
jgi:hypothetical protein